MSIQADRLAVEKLMNWLRWKLPDKVDAVNAARPAVLRATEPGPYTIGATSNKLVLSKTSRESGTTITLTQGSRTAAQIASDVNAGGLGTIGYADSDGFFYLQSTAAPAAPSTNSIISVQPVANSANSVFGWDAGGMHILNPPLGTPNHKSVVDGWPMAPDFGSGLVVIIGDRVARPVAPGPRRDEYLCAIELTVLRPHTSGEIHRTREPISAAVQCVREVLMADSGRSLGDQVMLVEEANTRVRASPFSFSGPNGQQLGPLFDPAVMNITVRVFERQ